MLTDKIMADFGGGTWTVMELNSLESRATLWFHDFYGIRWTLS